jgi:hypothetical protein
MPCSNQLSYFTTERREFLGSGAPLSTKRELRILQINDLRAMDVLQMAHGGRWKSHLSEQSKAFDRENDVIGVKEPRHCK